MLLLSQAFFESSPLALSLIFTAHLPQTPSSCDRPTSKRYLNVFSLIDILPDAPRAILIPFKH